MGGWALAVHGFFRVENFFQRVGKFDFCSYISSNAAFTFKTTGPCGLERYLNKMPTSLDDYEVLETIGTGSYGICKKIRRRKDGRVS